MAPLRPALSLFSLFFHENISGRHLICHRNPGLRAVPLLQ
jgi:hypothetical protein